MIRRTCGALLIALLGVFSLIPASARAQTAVSSTTLSSAIDNNQPTVSVASASGMTVGYIAMVDKEAMLINAINGTVLSVQRGYAGSAGSEHVASQVLYFGPTASGTSRGPFWPRDPNLGSCTYGTENYTLRLVPTTGRIWSCANGQWTNVVDQFAFVPPGACNATVSASSTGTNGAILLGTSAPAVQAQASGASNHYFTCTIPLPSRPNVLTAVYVVDVQFYYGVQTNALTGGNFSGSAGTLNGQLVFSYATYPTAAASETAVSGLVASRTRADSGTLVMTPAIASFNNSTTTSGSFYTMKLAPAQPFAMATDGTQYFLGVTLFANGGATISNSPGFVVHYRLLNVGI